MTKHIVTTILLSIICVCADSFATNKQAAQETDLETTIICQSSKEIPQFQGGENELFNYLNEYIKNIKKHSGTVYVYFKTSNFGSLHTTKFIGSVKNTSNLESKTLRVLNEMPI